MRRSVVGSWLLVGTLAGCAGAPANPPSASPTPNPTVSAVALPVVDECGMGHPVVRPVSLVLTCADANTSVHALVWSSWTATKAEATGLASINDCVPYCAAGHMHDYAARIELGKPNSAARNEFTVAKLVLIGSRPPGWANPDMSFPLVVAR